MPKPPKQHGRFEDLPVLTEVPETEADIPVLTEVLIDAPPPARPTTNILSDAQCREIIAQIAPHLESLLRDKFASRLESLWPEIWREIQAELPDLVRVQLAEPARRPKK
jgi:valyl-tRNA synthetase